MSSSQFHTHPEHTIMLVLSPQNQKTRSEKDRHSTIPVPSCAGALSFTKAVACVTSEFPSFGLLSKELPKSK